MDNHVAFKDTVARYDQMIQHNGGKRTIVD
jgi:hypothetical protein